MGYHIRLSPCGKDTLPEKAEMAINPGIQSIREAIDATAEAQKDAAFLISAETGISVSFQELRLQSISLGAALRSMGLEPGDKAAFLMDNGLRSAQIFLGTMYGGYVAVPLNVRAGAMQLTYMLDHCDAKVVFVAPQYCELLHEALGGVQRAIRVIETSDDTTLPIVDSGGEELLRRPPAGEDVAMLMYSSGSTGKPKAAIHTHRTILAHGRNSIEAHRLTAKDRSLLVLPLYHINAECVTLIPTLLSGGSVVVAQRFSVSRFWDWIAAYQVTWSALVPTIISELVNWDDPGKDGRGEAFARIRFFRSSSAPLAPTLHQQFLDKFKLPLIQAMGSTEGGNVFSNPVPPGANKLGSPGLPWGFETRIVDREGADVPRGESGEVVLRGAGLMRGYYKDVEETSAVLDSQGWLHTGDLACQDEDGYFFVVGRSKELIIKGGVNIAPRQIDEVLESHPAILEAAAVGVPDRYFGEDAIAFVVLRPEAGTDERELLSFCETRLGHFKTPSRIHFLQELPKGPSGKVQRLRLLDPDVLAIAATAKQGNAGTGNGHRAAIPGETFDGAGGASIEEIIAAAWAKVLGVAEVDRDANFFAAGGHSLLAIQCLAKLREKLPVSLSLPDFFEAGTVNAQAALVRQRMQAASATLGPQGANESTSWERSLLQQYVPAADDAIPHFDSTLPYPLSPAQQRLWFMELLNPNVPVYNEAEAVLLMGKLNAEALEKALNVIVDRHDILRSSIEVIDEVPHAVVHLRWPLRIKHIDLSAMPEVARQSELDRLLVEEPQGPYRLEHEPGIRVTLIRLGAEKHALILMMHHIICDWSSEGVIWRELSALYASFLSGEAVDLPAPPINHRDYAAWRQQKLDSASLAEDLAFWEKELSEAPALLELPADRERTPKQSHRGGRLRRKLSAELTEALRGTSRQERASLFTIFAAALNTLLYRYTGSDDVLLGVPLADRDQAELQSVVGFLLHVNVLRTRISGEMTFRDLLARVQKSVLDLYVHRSVPFDLLVQRLRPERSLSYSPLFQVMLNWRDRDQMLPFIGLEGLRIDSLMAHANTSKFDLFMFATDTGNEIWLELEYNEDLFDFERMARMLNHYQTVLESVAESTAARIDQISLLPSAECEQLLYAWNQTAAAYRLDKCVHQLFEEQVEKTPGATALDFEETSLSFGELNHRANRLAHYLRQLGVKPDDRVAICVERGLEMYVALLAVLKAGGAYVPLDPAFPAERLRFMLRDAEPVAALASGKHCGLVASLADGLRVIDLGDARRWIDQPSSNPDPAALGLSANHLAYIVYTSGSTGQPKGVMVEHRNLTNLVCSMREQTKIDSRDTLLAGTTITFDMAVPEIYLPLTTGARMRIVSREVAADGTRLLEELRRGVTFLQATPATWRLLLAAGWQGDEKLALICGAEAVSVDLAEQLVRQSSAAWNMYGPTETTVWSMVWRLEAGLKKVLIGRPIANTRVYLLDERREPVPVGITGELYIGGAGVARGYLNRPELTAERFIADPFADEPGARMYRTGDLGRYLPDGNIEFLGRNDFQVKLRGFRIELGEIEARLEKLEKVRQCVASVAGDDPANQHLIAYVVPRNSQIVPAAEELRNALKAQLPDYMVPAAFAILEQMPLTPNGKINRKALNRSNAMTVSSGIREMTAPRDQVEQKLVQIWERLLPVRPIGIRSSFFDLGGHSLLVVSLFAETKRVFQRSIPIAAIFGAPTIEQLAALIRGRALDAEASAVDVEKSLAQANSTIIPIQTSGSDAPLFMIHGGEGHILGFHRLATLTGADRPIYAVQAQSFLQGKSALLSVEDQSAYYLAEIRKIQPKGPYFLLGYCFGGLVALEIAHQLHEQGERVELVGLLDTRLRSQAMQVYRSAPVSTNVRRRASNIFSYLQRISLMKKITYIPEKILTHSLRGVYGLALSLGVRTVPAFLKDPGQIMRVAAMKYQPRPWPGEITVFRASVQPDSRMPDDLGWSSVAMGGVDVREVPGDHFAIFHDPHIQILAERVRQRLEGAGVRAA
jgi:amino acid adenylation domain-containing protein